MEGINYCSFKQAVQELPAHHANPKYDKTKVEEWLRLMEGYANGFGVIRFYLDNLYEAEVCRIGNLPILQSYNAFVEQAGTWLLDCTYCDSATNLDPVVLRAASRLAAKRWKNTVNITALMGAEGFLTAYVCDLSKGYNSKKRNEHSQALKYHENFSLTQVDCIPEDCVTDVLDFWLSKNSPISSTLAAYLWVRVAGTLLQFSSDKGIAYVGLAPLEAGRTVTFNSFWQPPDNRPPRIGVAALVLTRDWLIQNTSVQKLYLTTPVFGENTDYEVYKRHVATGTETVWSDYTIYSDQPELKPPYLLESTESWVM